MSAKNEDSMVRNAFQLFEKNKGPIQCMIELNIQPEDAKEYYNSYLEMKQEDFSAPGVPERLSKLEKEIDIIDNTITFIIINPVYGYGNSYCKAEEVNELQVETICRICGKKNIKKVN